MALHFRQQAARFWQTLTHPDPNASAAEIRRSTNLLSSMILSIIIIGAVFAALPAILINPPTQRMIEALVYYLLMLPPLLLAFVAAKRGLNKLSAYLSIIVLIVMIAGFSAQRGTAMQAVHTLIYLTIPIVLASVFLPARSTLAIFSMVLMVGIGVLFKWTMPERQSAISDYIAFILFPSAIILIGKRFRDQIEHDRTATMLQQEAMLKLATSSTSDGIILLDNKGVIIYATPSVEAMLMRRDGKLIGVPIYRDTKWMESVEPEHAAAFLLAMEEAKRTREARQVVVHMRRENGERRWIELNLNGVIDELGAILGVVCAIRDITDRVQDTREQMDKERLAIELKKERELSEVKSMFMNTISHEFRTPLTMINTSAEMLERYADRMTDERRAESLQTIRDQVVHLKTMLTDMTMLLQLQSDGTYTPENINVRAMLDKIIEEYRTIIAPEHKFVFEHDGQMEFIGADRRLMRNIVNNLLSNAIKYSAEGSTVKVGVRREGDTIRLCVSDQGRGIREEDRARLFDAFYRGRNVDDVSGSGLGLKIVQDSVALYRGKIDIESVVGMGTTFTVHVPILVP